MEIFWYTLLMNWENCVKHAEDLPTRQLSQIILRLEGNRKEKIGLYAYNSSESGTGKYFSSLQTTNNHIQGRLSLFQYGQDCDAESIHMLNGNSSIS